MKTNDLITALSADAPEQQMPPRRAFLIAIVLAAAIAAAIWIGRLGLHHDFLQSWLTPRFAFKVFVTAVLAVTAVFAARDMARPEVEHSRLRLLLWSAPLLLVCAVIAELIALPQSLWMVRLVGHNARFCMTMIPLMSLGPLVLMLWAFRRGAPANPARAGALAGLVAAGIASVFYAMHCPDDSPLFVATWYTLAIGFITGVGALLGSRLLRW
ncbi:MAG TPA: NrsF family protein [Rhizomicrobium sp.]|jgi:hypothetical protein